MCTLEAKTLDEDQERRFSELTDTHGKLFKERGESYKVVKHHIKTRSQLPVITPP